MKTKQDLIREVFLLKDRLEKAIVFEVTEDISIGMSESDGLFRIRREEPTGEISFLNRNYQWEQQAHVVDLAYSERTGYYTADDAFNMLEIIKEVIPSSVIFNSKILKNN